MTHRLRIAMIDISGLSRNARTVASQYEHAHTRRSEHRFLVGVAPDRAVFCQHHPASAPGLCQPVHIGRVLIEHLVMNDDCGVRRAQRLDNELAAEASINEEDDFLRGGGLTRQAAIGSE